MRVITGSARGIRLDAPRSGFRPTMDRVRGAVFSALGGVVPGARVLDLFAGSGGYGIEALSRGARGAVFVDSSAEACRCIRRNLARAGVAGVVQAMDAFRFLELYAGEGDFDLVFADPPYAKSPGDRDFASELVAGGLAGRALAADGLFVLECAAGGAPASPGLTFLRSRRYGGTQVLLFAKPS